MFELLMLGLADSTQPRAPVVRSIPVPPQVSVPVVEQVIVRQGEAGKLAVTLLPDLVVSEVRVEDDRTAHFKVTNQGTADVRRSFGISADAYIDSRRGEAPLGSGIGPDYLAMGESKWIAISGFSPTSEPYYVGKDYSFPLGKATAFTVRVDPPAASTGGFFGGGGGTDLQDMFGGGKKAPKCDSNGCIRESDETNNYLKVEGDAIIRGKPE
ncbi:MAG TPA: hypothetical protein VNA29_03360 [Sphingomicrobium sp.]|nr:hypothetical protein [Sphingomicrobium sp.]